MPIYDFAGMLPEWLSYLGIPITAALVGWATNVLAVKMTFWPLEFKGIPPYLGWQGIIPNKSKSMAEKSVDMITTKLISFDEQFQKIDPLIVANTMKPDLERLSKKIVDEVMYAKAPLIWKAAPQKFKNKIYKESSRDLPQIVIEFFYEIKGEVDELFDIKTMVIKALVNDKQLLNDIFLECGRKEFEFVKISGLYFGFLFGMIQMAIWYFIKPWWFLPFAGLLVGYVTNWIALKLIFSPLHPKKIGPFKLHGLFIQRQQEVSEGYAKLVQENIITSENIFDSLLDGPQSAKLYELLGKHIKEVVESVAEEHETLVNILYSPEKMKAIKNIAVYSFLEDFPILIHRIYNYTEKALDVQNTLQSRMAALSPEDFAGFLRPIFQEDEWKLITVGAILGMMAGFIQYFLLF